MTPADLHYGEGIVRIYRRPDAVAVACCVEAGASGTSRCACVKLSFNLIYMDQMRLISARAFHLNTTVLEYYYTLYGPNTSVMHSLYMHLVPPAMWTV